MRKQKTASLGMLKPQGWIWALLLIAVLAFAPRNAVAYTFKVLHSFCSQTTCADGDFPEGKLVLFNGALYGVAAGGGASGAFSQGGLVYELTFNNSTGKWGYSILYKFCSLSSCADGEQDASGRNPVALIADGTGHLYGTTPEGGKFGQGTVYKLTKSGGSWTEQVLYDFCQSSSCTDGAVPGGDVALDLSGNLYGTTLNGGSINVGTAYEVTAAGKHTVLYSFGVHTSNGISPNGVFLGNGGALYGTAGSGGRDCCSGVAFRLTPTATPPWKATALYKFCRVSGCRDGSSPAAGLVTDGAGDWFGTTRNGGKGSHCATAPHGECGVAFELPSGGGEKVLHSFCSNANTFGYCIDGEGPNGDLLVDGATVYGTTNHGGKSDSGIIFQLSFNAAKGKWVETILHNFCSKLNGQGFCADGSNPNWSGLIMDGSGNLYGVADSGGDFDGGVVFELVK